MIELFINPDEGAVFGVEVASDWNDKCYGFEIDKVTSDNTYVQYVGIWKT